MGELISEQDHIKRVEKLVNMLGLSDEWSQGVFDGCAYEHILPVLEATFQHFVRPLGANGEIYNRRELERSYNETFGSGEIGTITHSSGFALSPPHQVMMNRLRDYVVYGSIEYPIEEWSVEELFSEYDHAWYWTGVWGIVSGVSTLADVGVTIVATATAILTTSTAIAVATAGVGIIVTLLGAAAAYATYIHYKKTRDGIREEIQKRIEYGQIDQLQWDDFDLEIRRKYNS